MAYVQVHRFRGNVAAAVGKGETTYLTPAEARKLARALNACARNCKAQPQFSKSDFRTVSFNVSGEVI